MLLKLENIGKIYNSNDLLVVGIRGINLEFDYNEFVTIEGESGGGKSTLLNVIGANDTYEEGELWFNGEETSHYGKAEWERYREENIATIFQDFNIIENLTVVQNVELALLRYDDKRKRRKIALELIDKVGLTKQANQKGSRLSGGEKQRTVIARALAKDSPIILADEPTGNLDVKASKEVAKLLKDVSKDKLVIVVTHNPEFFKEYATRRVRVYDGSISEDEVIEPPKPLDHPIIHEENNNSRLHNFKNILHIGALNYQSRPKFTAMMSFALLICAITLFMVISILGSTMIKPLTDNIDLVGIDGKLIISTEDDSITGDDLDILSNKSNAGYFFLDRSLSEFEVNVIRGYGSEDNYKVICLYDPYKYSLKANEGVLVIPASIRKDAKYIKNTFTYAGVGLDDIKIVESIDARDIRLYLGYDALAKNGKQIRAINSGLRLGEDNNVAYKFIASDEVSPGEINLINSTYWNVLGKIVVFEASAEKSYRIVKDDEKDTTVDGLVIKMNTMDFNQMFKEEVSSRQACLYYENDELANKALSLLPDGFMGLISSREVYKNQAGDIYTTNIIYYIAMILVSVLFGALISIIFIRSVKVFETDFAVYKTLGIPSKVALRSLYVQMGLIFLPTLILLPLISLIAAIIPGSMIGFISIGNYLFIEIMLFMIVELVALGFNRSINKRSIRISLRRGSK